MRDESPASGLADVFDEALRAIAENAALPGRFLNTLSLLEYIGARKIIKSQPEESMSLNLLSHAAEELRHAKVLKRVAMRLGGGSDIGYAAEETLCGFEARTYFQTLDDRVVEALGVADPRATYLYETLLIEERALWAYPKIVAAFQNEWVSAATRGLLVEEERHLTDIRKAIEVGDPGHPARLDALRAIEASLFASFADALKGAARAWPSSKRLQVAAPFPS